jgi:hypothetical protein
MVDFCTNAASADASDGIVLNSTVSSALFSSTNSFISSLVTTLVQLQQKVLSSVLAQPNGDGVWEGR